MAQSRLERIGTIYSRVSSLLKGGGMKEMDKPLWYKIYENFPPKYEPYYGRPAKDIPIKEIFYEEDVIRAKFHKDHKNLPHINLNNHEFNSATQWFLALYQKMKEEGVDEAELYSKAVETYFSQAQSFKTNKKFVKNEASNSHVAELKKQLDSNEAASTPQNNNQKDTTINVKELFDDKQ